MAGRTWRRSEVESFGAVESHGCPYRYQQVHLLGVDDSGEETIRGRAFHAAAWVYVLRLAKKQLASDHEEAALAFKEGLAITGCPDPLLHQVHKLFFAWAERFELDVEAFLAAEVLERTGDRVFRPDLVYCRPYELEIEDFKTFYRGLTPEQAATEIQLKWYLLEAVKTWPGFPSYRFTYNFVRLGYKVSLAFTPDQIAQWEGTVQASIDAVLQAEAKNEFPALPGSHCRFCRLACPIADDPIRLPIRITSEAQRDDVAGAILIREQELRQMKTLLAGHCELEGPFHYRGQQFGHFEQNSQRFPAAQVIHFLEDRGADVSKITVSKAALGDFAKPKRSTPAVLMKLDDLAIRKQRWTFTHKAAGEPDTDPFDDVLANQGEEGGENGDSQE